MKTTNNNRKDIRDYKTNGKQFAYILDNIHPYTYTEEEGEKYTENPTDKDRIAFFVRKFEEEFNGNKYNRYCWPNRAERIGQFLQGLPSGVDLAYWDEEIINLGKAWGFCKTKKQETDFANNWFRVMGQRIEQIANYYEVKFNF